MFVKKDTRKIPEILNDEPEELHLARRSSEFVPNGVKVVCSSRNTGKLQNLQRMSIYDNMLTNVKGIGALSTTPLRHLNLGRNQLKSLPSELGKVGTLETLWVDDNAILDFPHSVLALRRLQELRLSGNRIVEVPEEISNLSALRVLALDNNDLKTVPKSISKLSHLQTLLLRQNELEELPEEMGQLLEMRNLCISSNRLRSLPASLGKMRLLEFLYANGNRLGSLPGELSDLVNLKKVNLSNNEITFLPETVEAAWGQVDVLTGKLDPNTVGSPLKAEVIVRGNPFVDAASKRAAAAEEEAAAMDDSQ